MSKDSIQILALEFIEKKDEVKFTKLYNRLKPGLYTFAIKILKDKALTDDAVTETFISIWSKIDQYKKEYNFSTWAYAIARNVCFGALKEKKKTVSMDKVAFKSPERQFMYTNKIMDRKDDSLSHEGEILLQTLYDASINAINNLQEPYKTVAIEREINQKQLNEIADQLGWNLNTVKTRLTKARKDVADTLSKQYPELVNEYLFPQFEEKEILY